MLCVLVTFAWINELQNPHGRYLTLRMENASVASSDIEVKLSVNVNDDIFKDITEIRLDESTQTIETVNNFAPGSRQRFRIDITNLNDTPVILRLIMSDIVCDKQELMDNIIIGTNGFLGFTSEYPAPNVQTKVLSDGIDKSGSFILMDELVVPPNVGEPISVFFYVMFSAAGTELFENSSFSIGTINFLTI
jgi:hypothetical protein